MSASSDETLGTDPSSENLRSTEPPRQVGNFWTCVKIVWPLTLHSITAVAIALVLLFVVNGTEFGLTERYPNLPLAYGQSIHSNQFLLLQPDVVTTLSAAITAVRLILAAWSSSFCWNSVVFLMSERGLPRRQLKGIVGCSLLWPDLSWRHYNKALIGAALWINITASSAGPLLTGSVSWLPSSRLYSLEPHPPQLNISYLNNCSKAWELYQKEPVYRRAKLQTALGYATLAWGRQVDTNILKRTIPSASGLQAGSSLAEVTLPYFSIDRIEWLDRLPGNSTVLSLFRLLIRLVLTGPLEPGDFRVVPGYVSFIPKAGWSNETAPRFPPNELVQDTQLAIFNYGALIAPPTSFADRFIPPFHPTRKYHFAYARVSYTAGISRCYNCSISSPSVIESHKRFLVPEKDSLTREALAMAPVLASTLVTMNSSIPFPANCGVNEYVTALLTRSYSASWSALTDMGRNNTHSTTSYSPAISSLKAQVNAEWVWTWLGLQLLVSLPGIVFLVVLPKSKSQLSGGTALAGFYLDTTDVPLSGRDPVFNRGVLRLRSNGDRLKVNVIVD